MEPNGEVLFTSDAVRLIDHAQTKISKILTPEFVCTLRKLPAWPKPTSSSLLARREWGTREPYPAIIKVLDKLSVTLTNAALLFPAKAE